MIQVGQSAPDFKTPAFFSGKIKQIRLSDYRRQWVLLFFYPADFSRV